MLIKIDSIERLKLRFSIAFNLGKHCPMINDIE